MRNIVNLFPCQSGHEVIQQGGTQLAQEIRNLISAPSGIYQSTYEKTLYNFAEICQSMPYAENGSLYSLLQRQLNICIAALRLRQGKLLPENAEPENMAKEEPQYSYAIFTAGLLYGLDKIQHNRKIKFYNAKKEACREWHPLNISLYAEDRWFDVQWISCEKSEILPRAVFNCIIAMTIIPPKIMQWMSANTKLVPLWWNAMTSETSEISDISDKKNNPISDIIQQAIVFADKKSSQSDKKIKKFHQKKEEENKERENKKNPENTENAENLFKKLLDFLETKQEQDIDNILRVHAGLFITKSRLQEFTEDFQVKSIDNLVQIINPYLVTENNQYYQKYRHKLFENRKLLEGIVIGNQYLNHKWLSHPHRDEFQPDIA